ncbi:hypothetical protein [Barthadenovirus sternae]|nr:hypothetical protein [Tern atadenovirus 1]
MAENSTTLYNSIINTTVDFPNCFAGNLQITTLLDINFANIAAVANAFGRFFTSDYINSLYIVGGDRSHALYFFNDLQCALESENELGFYTDDMESTDGVKSIFYKQIVPSNVSDNMIVLEFSDTSIPYEHFSRQDFASFVYCGNTEYGPIDKFACKRHAICINRQFSHRRPCIVCNRPNRKERLKPVTILNVWSEDYLDEGVAVEPLGIPKALFLMNFDTTDSDTDSD